MAETRCPICETLFDNETDYNGYRLQNGWSRRNYCTKNCSSRFNSGAGPYRPRISNCSWCAVEFDRTEFGPNGEWLGGHRWTCSNKCFDEWNDYKKKLMFRKANYRIRGLPRRLANLEKTDAA